MEPPDQSGGGVMSQDPKPRDKVEEESQQDIKTTREYRNFRKLLKQVIKAPPMRLGKIMEKPPILKAEADQLDLETDT